MFGKCVFFYLHTLKPWSRWLYFEKGVALNMKENTTYISIESRAWVRHIFFLKTVLKILCYEIMRKCVLFCLLNAKSWEKGHRIMFIWNDSELFMHILVNMIKVTIFQNTHACIQQTDVKNMLLLMYRHQHIRAAKKRTQKVTLLWFLGAFINSFNPLILETCKTFLVCNKI